MSFKNAYLAELMETVKKRNANEPEFHQAVDLCSVEVCILLYLQYNNFDFCLNRWNQAFYQEALLQLQQRVRLADLLRILDLPQ